MKGGRHMTDAIKLLDEELGYESDINKTEEDNALVALTYADLSIRCSAAPSIPLSIYNF